MSKGDLVIGGDMVVATQTFVNAVTYMGGSVTSMIPSRPVEFKISRSGKLGGYGAPYSGTATFVQMASDQTKVLVEIKPRAVFTATSIAASIGVIALAGSASQDEETIMMITVILLPVLAVMLYLYHVPWGAEVMDKLKAGIHGAVPLAHSPRHASNSPVAASPALVAERSSPIADQMQQLAALKEQGLVSEEEFAAKKAELLKRL